MGKKKIVKQTEEELLKETEKVETAIGKAKAKDIGSRKIEVGRIYINASYNNTCLTVTDRQGNAIAWVSAGSLGFSGPKKATPFAASKIVAALAEKLKKFNLFRFEVTIKGVGAGRDSALRALINQKFDIISIKDTTPIPHNGPRPPKVRRV